MAPPLPPLLPLLLLIPLLPPPSLAGTSWQHLRSSARSTEEHYTREVQVKVEGARVEVGELVVLLEPGLHLLEVVAEEVRAKVVEVLGEEVHTATLEGRSDCSGWMFLEGELVRSATLACRC